MRENEVAELHTAKATVAPSENATTEIATTHHTKSESLPSSATLKYQVVQACSYCVPFMLVDVGVKPMVCGMLTIFCCATLPTLTVILLKRPWREVVFIALSSTLFGAIISSIACSMLHPEKLIYGFMLSNHIAVTLPIMFFLTIALVIPAMVQQVWDFNARLKPLPPLPPLTPELLQDQESI